MENQILVYQNKSGQVVLEDVINGRIRSRALYPDFSNTLEGNAECSARLFHYSGLGFGDYQVTNGKKLDNQNGITDATKTDARNYSTINFAILNEMFRLIEPKALETQTA
ncbi:hypothetical protein J4429_03605 [Candidatus Pacearchaeota archaeon]|nr:hypothetical protein [Candidatus Pacearchaeota archaeon]